MDAHHSSRVELIMQHLGCLALITVGPSIMLHSRFGVHQAKNRAPVRGRQKPHLMYTPNPSRCGKGGSRSFLGTSSDKGAKGRRAVIETPKREARVCDTIHEVRGWL